MKLALTKERSFPSGDERPSTYRTVAKTLLSCRELYFILAIAAFLRFYLLPTTEFDDDQAAVFGMAHNAVQHGWLVATSNIASIHIVNPPAVIYLYMLPALFSANPLGGAIFTALCNTLAVGLCYLFVRRYYGRLAASIAALFFATATLAVFYARFIWQQNLLPLFVLLYIFSLFLGVVERRKGWLFPAIVLLGLLIQLHASTVLLSATLLVALLLSPGTLRWRDLALGLLGLLLIYFPYLLWEIATKFNDVQILLSATKQHVKTPNLASFYYQLFLSPYNPNLLPANLHAPIYVVKPWISWLFQTMHWLNTIAMLFLLLRALWPVAARADTGASTSEETLLDTPSATRSHEDTTHRVSTWFDGLPVPGYMKRWWLNLLAMPARCGLLILLAWQAIPLFLLSHMSTELYPHYFIFFLPGQFIVIGILFAQLVHWCERFGTWGEVARLLTICLTILITTAQFAGSFSSVLDYGLGYYNELQIGNPYYDDLHSLQYAMTLADQIAQRNHLNHVYVSTNPSTQAALGYLAAQMHTPTTLFDDEYCMVLPAPTDGPAVMLVNPYSSLTQSLLAHFHVARQVAQAPRLGGPPFRLYIVRSLPTTATVGSLGDYLRLATMSQPTLFSADHSEWYATLWNMLRSTPAQYRTTYTYQLQETPNGVQHRQDTATCMLNSARSGDQLIVAFNVPTTTTHVSFVLFRGQFYQSSPYNLVYGPITMETYITRRTHSIALGSIRYSTATG